MPRVQNHQAHQIRIHRAKAKAREATKIIPSKEVLKARKDFAFFCGWVTRNSPEPCIPAEHHLEWHDILITGKDSKCLRGIAGDNLDLLAPRGSAKSTVLGLFAAWTIGNHALEQMPLQILYLSYSLNAARAKSSTIKTIIESPEYQEVFPQVKKGDRWSDQYWSIDHKAAGIKSSGTERFTMVCAGLTGSITSKRCFPRGTMVETSMGRLPVEELGKYVGVAKALSYNHRTNELEYKTIQAFASRRADELVEIETSGGNKLRCTANHPIYIPGQGYKQAGDLVQGQPVIILAKPKRQRTKVLRLQLPDDKEKQRPYLQAVLPLSPKDGSSSQVRSLRQAVQPISLRDKQADSGRLCDSVLQLGMFQSKQVNLNVCSKVLPGLQTTYLREKRRQQQQKEILFRLWCKEKKEDHITCNRLSSVSENLCFRVSFKKNCVLLKRLSKQSSLNQDAGNRQQSLQKRGQLQQAVQGNKTSDTRKRQLYLSGLQHRSNNNGSQASGQDTNQNKLASASLGREAKQQCTRELDYALRSVPHQASCSTQTWEADTISSVKRVSVPEQLVYDIQVEGNHNLFAQGILSHNCNLILIDDPVKSADQIATSNVRDKMERNWNAVIRPTLLEGGRCICLGTRFRPDDIHCTLFSPARGWMQIEQRALIEDEDGNERSYWEKMWSTEYLKGLRKDDPYSFSFQYQNIVRAVESLGIELGWVQYDEIPDYFDRYVLGIDLAASLKTKADYTAMMLVGVLKDRYYFIDYRRGKWMGNMEKCDAMLGLLAEWIEPETPVTIFVEAQAYQTSFKGDFTTYIINEKRLYNLHCIPWKMKGDKLAHILSVSGTYANGGVVYNKYIFHPQSPPVSEMVEFGAVPHDDCMDASVIALQGAGIRRRIIAQ
jgi:phage terminase large subunit-like protein